LFESFSEGSLHVNWQIPHQISFNWKLPWLNYTNHWKQTLKQPSVLNSGNAAKFDCNYRYTSTSFTIP